MAWHEVRKHLADATPDYIAWFRSLPGVEGDRDIASARSKRRVSYLRKKLAQGKFVTPDWWVARCLATGETYRLNGQASSLVLHEADGLLPLGLQVLLREIEADTYSDVVDCFTNIDNPISGRPVPEQLAPILKSRPRLAGCPPSYARKALYGIVFFDGGCRGRTLEHDERHQMVVSHEDFLAWAAPLMRNKRFGSSVAVVAAAYGTYLASPRQGKDFWLHVINEDGPAKNCPSRTLADFLKARDLDPVEKRRWDKRAVFVKCVLAWNAWVRGTTTQLAYYPEAKATPEIVVRRGDSVVKADVSPMK